MDDATVLTALTNPADHHAIANHIQNLLYDQEHKRLLVKLQPGLDFLDCTFVIFNNNTSVKVVHKNKNLDFPTSGFQTVGRFHRRNCPSPIKHKLNAILTVLIRSFDSTTFPIDLLPSFSSLIIELYHLNYSPNDFFSNVLRASRTRPDPFWLNLTTHLQLPNRPTALHDATRKNQPPRAR
jgi:hypothetical protein